MQTPAQCEVVTTLPLSVITTVRIAFMGGRKHGVHSTLRSKGCIFVCVEDQGCHSKHGEPPVHSAVTVTAVCRLIRTSQCRPGRCPGPFSYPRPCPLVAAEPVPRRHPMGWMVAPALPRRRRRRRLGWCPAPPWPAHVTSRNSVRVSPRRTKAHICSP